ncbi:DUF3592 domain-containing protein [Streptomyces sp. NPDC050617]|uniref:DUF3592 domain-containing protein n=1 Tax=Streptomyces sp. NPDC050617 TaxID=3154628 RepID=UPI0034343D95
MSFLSSALVLAIPALMACLALYGIGRVAERRRRLTTLWRTGLTAQGRCLRAYATTRGGDGRHTVLRHVYEYRTRDGRPVRFEETGPATVMAGDTLTVRYLPDQPEQATALQPDNSGMLRAAAASMAVLTALLAVIVCCLAVYVAVFM